jgi:hypothetical protein
MSFMQKLIHWSIQKCNSSLTFLLGSIRLKYKQRLFAEKTFYMYSDMQIFFFGMPEEGKLK